MKPAANSIKKDESIKSNLNEILKELDACRKLRASSKVPHPVASSVPKSKNIPQANKLVATLTQKLKQSEQKLGKAVSALARAREQIRKLKLRQSSRKQRRLQPHLATWRPKPNPPAPTKTPTAVKMPSQTLPPQDGASRNSQYGTRWHVAKLLRKIAFLRKALRVAQRKASRKMRELRQYAVCMKQRAALRNQAVEAQAQTQRCEARVATANKQFTQAEETILSCEKRIVTTNKRALTAEEQLRECERRRRSSAVLLQEAQRKINRLRRPRRPSTLRRVTTWGGNCASRCMYKSFNGGIIMSLRKQLGMAKIQAKMLERTCDARVKKAVSRVESKAAFNRDDLNHCKSLLSKANQQIGHWGRNGSLCQSRLQREIRRTRQLATKVRQLTDRLNKAHNPVNKFGRWQRQRQESQQQLVPLKHYTETQTSRTTDTLNSRASFDRCQSQLRQASERSARVQQTVHKCWKRLRKQHSVNRQRCLCHRHPPRIDTLLTSGGRNWVRASNGRYYAMLRRVTGDGQWKFITYAEGQRLCHAANARVASFDADGEVYDTVIGVLVSKLFDLGTCWLGYKRQRCGVYRSDDERRVALFSNHWAKNQPDNKRPEENCIFVDTAQRPNKHGQYLIGDRHCKERSSYVMCQMSKSNRLEG